LEESQIGRIIVPTPPSTPAPKEPASPEVKFNQSPLFVDILNELNANVVQLQKRQTLITAIEEALSTRYGAQNRMISYVFRFGHPRAAMESVDIPSFETILNSVSGAEQINVLLHSPGGDGTIVEKMVDMCRGHLSGNNRKLRIVVPNIAKSAATVMALGSDTIVMGYCSELGPIDPQIRIVVSGATQGVSALSFVEARDQIMADIATAIKNKTPTVGLLQQLAGLNIPFTQEMAHQIDFAKKTAARLLGKYMLMPSFPNQKTRAKKANEIAEKLLSKKLFPVHGHFIDGETAKRELELNVEVLDKNDKLWQLLWEYYVRSEVQMNIPLQAPHVKIKLFESSKASLVVQDSAT
jgi:Serine dehydrogenase proteinase